MRTMKQLVKRFNRMYSPEMEAWLDELESYPGCYRVAISDGLGMTSCYIFKTCEEFKDWTDNIC